MQYLTELRSLMAPHFVWLGSGSFHKKAGQIQPLESQIRSEPSLASTTAVGRPRMSFFERSGTQPTTKSRYLGLATPL